MMMMMMMRWNYFVGEGSGGEGTMIDGVWAFSDQSEE